MRQSNDEDLTMTIPTDAAPAPTAAADATAPTANTMAALAAPTDPTPCGPPPTDYAKQDHETEQKAASTYVYQTLQGPNPCGLEHMARIAHALTPEDQAQVIKDIEAEQQAPTVTPLTPSHA